MVVEGESILRDSLVMQLEALGFAATAASNSDEALEIMRTSPDMRLMVLDSNISGRTGALELAAMASSVAPNVRVVMVSGFSDSARIGQGPDPEWTLLKKPFSNSELGLVIRNTLSA